MTLSEASIDIELLLCIKGVDDSWERCSFWIKFRSWRCRVPYMYISLHL